MNIVHISDPLPLSSHGKPVDSFSQATELENELKRVVKGEVRFDRGSRAMYATDASITGRFQLDWWFLAMTKT